jgi:iron complex outermembrane receptor protein
MSYLSPIDYDPANTNIVRSADIDTNTKGAYFEAMVRLTRKLTLSGGSRIDHLRNNRYTYSTDSNNLVTFHATTGRVALTYALTPTVNVYVGRSSAYQPSGTGTNSTGATALVNITQSQAQFVLQRSRSWEGGVKASAWRDRVEGTLAYFNMRKYDILTQELIDGVTFIERVGKVESEGVEFEFTARPMRLFTLQSNFTYNNAHYLVLNTVANGVEVDRAGNRLARTPTVKWSVAPTIRIGAVSGNISFNTRGPSWNDTANTQRLQQYTTLNSNIIIRMGEQTTLTLTGRNLTDVVTVNRGGVVAGATTARIGLPRNYGMQLTKTF